jgi:hypothetical protein
MQRESAYALAARAVQALIMAIAGVLVALRFSPDEQGLFFTFMSLGALIQLGEFGLGYSILQISSHLAANAGAGGEARLQAMAYRARRLGAWLLPASGLLCAALGVLLLRHRAGVDAQGPVLGLAPWLAYAAAVPLAHAVNLVLLFVEGARSVRRAWRIRLVQEVLAGAVFVLSLLAGAGLWSLVVHALARAGVSAVGLWLDTAHAPRPASGSAASFDWRREAWPFQWRVGLSALAGYFVFQAFNPLLLLEQGAEAAGRFGLSLAIMNMLLLLSGAWPLSQAARYGRWLAAREHALLEPAFRRMLVGSTSLTLGLALLVIAIQAGLEAIAHPFAQRLADLPTTAALMVAAVLNHVTVALAVLLRAERREPLLALSTVGGALTLAAVWWAARGGSLFSPALAAALMSSVGLAWTWLLYRAFAVRTFGTLPAAGAAP